jgi:hypothetical protein
MQGDERRQVNEWFDSIDDIAPRRRAQEAKRAAERAAVG